MTELANNENLCPACLSKGSLRYPEKLEDNLFNDLTFASRKRPELMHYDLFECENCKTLFTNRNVNLSQLLKNYEIAEYDSNVEAKYAAKTYVKNGGVSGRQAVYKDAEIAKSGLFGPMVQTWEKYGNAVFRPRFPEWPAMSEQIAAVGTDIQSGKISVKDGAAKLDASILKILTDGGYYSGKKPKLQ